MVETSTKPSFLPQNSPKTIKFCYTKHSPKTSKQPFFLHQKQVVGPTKRASKNMQKHRQNSKDSSQLMKTNHQKLKTKHQKLMMTKHHCTFLFLKTVRQSLSPPKDVQVVKKLAVGELFSVEEGPTVQEDLRTAFA